MRLQGPVSNLGPKLCLALTGGFAEQLRSLGAVEKESPGTAVERRLWGILGTLSKLQPLVTSEMQSLPGNTLDIGYEGVVGIVYFSQVN